MKRWNIYYCGLWIDSVYYLQTCDEDYVRTSLINHDGYPTQITIEPSNN
jgi:hypothetical protein